MVQKVHLHNKVLDPSPGGEDFLQVYRQAANDELDVPRQGWESAL